jgi:hypothetical protein
MPGGMIRTKRRNDDPPMAAGKLKLHGENVKGIEIEIKEDSGAIIAYLVFGDGTKVPNGRLFCLSEMGMYLYYGVNPTCPIQLEQGQIHIVNK